MGRVGKKHWGQLCLLGGGVDGDCGKECKRGIRGVVKKLFAKKKAAGPVKSEGSFMKFRDSQMGLQNRRSSARRAGQFSGLSGCGKCTHYGHLLEVRRDGEYSTDQLFVKLSRAIINDDAQRISIGSGFFVLTQFDQSFSMNFTLIRKIADISFSEQHKASPTYDGCLGIIVKLKKVDDRGFYLLDIEKAYVDIDLFKEVSENIFKRVDSFLLPRYIC